MRYYFHLESGTNIHIDPRGVDFERRTDVINHASAMARDLGDDERWVGWSLRVIDEGNAEVFCVPIRASVLSTK
ncbi:hypothetical protein W911_15120 [Hyphomicrobium nitrativorans NL23]|uniref:DUF6894 domain-containing protein n=1 Tax=Hyphomicrobium nitrativorans NL23 TaxID=1029756 RepID=V5SHP1_9HYPH|nr:hypothetical protein [Hyphomicrobium nitrativorans]AHB50371.1 hypothetical protein W911_15120 [Hyphomicrobium nitrativorans NL23]